MSEQYVPVAENDPKPRDVSREFLSMDYSDFKGFLRSLGRATPIAIEIDWVNVGVARKCKALMDDFSIPNPKKIAIRATSEQKREDVNAFQSGVKWIEVK